MNSVKKKPFDWYFKSNLLIRILIGLIAGAIVGIIFGPKTAWMNPFGAILVNLLKMIVMPVVLSTLIVGAASINPSTLGKIGVKIIVFYLITSAFAVAVGLLMGNIFKPGLGLELGGAAEAAGKVLAQPKLSDTLIAIIPKNPFGAISGGAVLPTIFFAIILGVAISYLKQSENERIKKSGETLFSAIDGLAEAMYLIVRGVLQYAPIGVFCTYSSSFWTTGCKSCRSARHGYLCCIPGICSTCCYCLRGNSSYLKNKSSDILQGSKDSYDYSLCNKKFIRNPSCNHEGS